MTGIEKLKIAKYLSDAFDCPCNYSPLDEEMYEYCMSDKQCQDSEIECWQRVIDKVLSED